MRYFETQTTERIGFDFYCDLAQEVFDARKAKGWTQEELAKATKLTPSKVFDIENIKCKTKLKYIEVLAEALDVTVNRLIRGENDSQIGDCLYLLFREDSQDFKLYQKAPNKRMAYLLMEQRLNEIGVRLASNRERYYVKLVGVPITDRELKDRFPKMTNEDEAVPL